MLKFLSEVSQKEKNKYHIHNKDILKKIPYTNTYTWTLKKKNGYEEPRGRTGIKTQTQRMDLRTWGGGRVSWDEVREWRGHIYTDKCKTDSQWEAAA